VRVCSLSEAEHLVRDRPQEAGALRGRRAPVVPERGVGRANRAVDQARVGLPVLRRELGAGGGVHRTKGRAAAARRLVADQVLTRELHRPASAALT
jgi:hypothetical protein